MPIGTWEMRYRPTASATTPLSSSIELQQPEKTFAVTKCKVCGKELPDAGCVTIEADEEYMNKHIEDDNAEFVLCYHRKCFEEHFKVSLPVVGSDTPRYKSDLQRKGGASTRLQRKNRRVAISNTE